MKINQLFNPLPLVKFKRCSLFLLGLLGWSFLSISQTIIPYQIKNVKIVAGGFIPGIEFHPREKGLVYLRTDIGGAYRLDTTTKTWIPLTDQFGPGDWNYTGIDAIGLDPNDPDRLYLGAGTYTNGWAGNGAILRSTDRGNTLEVIPLSFMLGGNEDGRSTGEKLVVDPHSGNILFLGTRRNGLWKSVDYGSHWSKVNSFPIDGTTSNNIGITFILMDSTVGSMGSPSPKIYIGTADKNANLYVSDDAGANWTKVAGQPTGMLPHHARLTGTGFMYLTYSDGPGPNGISTGAVWKLKLDDYTWTKLKSPDGQGGFGGLAMDAQNPDVIMVGTMDRWWPGDEIYRSADGGLTWKAITPNDVRDVSLSPYVTWQKPLSALGTGNWIGDIEIDPFNSNDVYYGTGATLWGCHNITDLDQGLPTNWQIDANGVEETAILDLASPPSGPYLYSAIGDISGFAHYNLTQSPPDGFFVNDGGTNTGIKFAWLQPNYVVRVGVNSAPIAYSNDFGKTWKAFASLPEADAKSGKVAVSADGLTTIWVPDSKKPYVTHSNGIKWKACQGLFANTRVIADKMNSDVFYAVSGTSFYKSTDKGETFSKISNVTNNPKIESVPDREGNVWLAASNGLFMSMNGGTSFNQVSGTTMAESVSFGKAAVSDTFPTVFIIGKIKNTYGIFRTTNLGNTWDRVNDNKHQFAGIHDIVGDPRVFGRYYICTNGRGIIYGEPSVDCNNDTLGTAYIDACGVCVGGNTNIEPCEVTDCNGDANGTAYTDQCGECVGGNTGKTPCTLTFDCNGDLNGTAYLDNCDICVGGNTGLEPCTGVGESGEGNLKIYPNPTKSSFTVQSTGLVYYELVNIAGLVFESGTCNGKAIVGEQLMPGIYFVRIKNESIGMTFKLIKE